MDDTVNNFLKEINEIVPPKHTTPENGTFSAAWKECFDKQSGFPYYWNQQTDEVTWQMPEDYQSSGKKCIAATRSLSVPTESVKIYKIESERRRAAPQTISESKAVAVKRGFKSGVDSDDEKITLISSYGGDTESEEDEDATEAKKPQPAPPPQKISVDKNEDEILQNDVKVEVKKEISGFKLVAGYSSDEEEQEESEDKDESEPKTTKVVQEEEEEKPCSTLFPITERATLEQLKVADETTPPTPENETIDTKIFQRKRKIDIDIVNAQNNKPKLAKSEDEHAGFGYKFSNYTDYLGFKSGGVMFGKNEETPASPKSKGSEVGRNDAGEFEETKTMLCEKLAFLSEGHATVSPVQTMMIQVETLYTAVKQGSLNTKYFYDWLNDTCTDLIKLEQEAAPSGWLLQWDRLNKRYFYQNKVSGESQWEYPQPDVIRCDEAMDISTTPPPPPLDDDGVKGQPEAPPPPKIRDCQPLPPPAPLIGALKDKTKKSDTAHEQLANNEPLPPGVDSLEIEIPVTKADHLNSALSSFYSEMATISTTTAANEAVNTEDNSVKLVENDKVKKKKKAKVKIAQGLAMKKKGVSKLVEKWKHVQNNY